MTRDSREVWLWQHDESGRTCWMEVSPGAGWNRVGTPRLSYYHHIEALTAEVEALRKERDRLKADANRARFLREHPEDFVVSMNIGFDWVSVRGEDLVEELDAAIAKEGET